MRGRAGGVALYISTVLPPAVVLNLPNIPNIDCLWVKISLSRSESLLVGVVYRPPSCRVEESHLLLNQLKCLNSFVSYSHLLVTGDFNAPGINWHTMSSLDVNFSGPLLELVSEMSWTQHVSCPTRYRSGQRPSLLDLVITGEQHLIDVVSQLPPVGKSDHVVLAFDMIVQWPSCNQISRTLRSFKRTNFAHLRLSLQNSIAQIGQESGVEHLTLQIEQCIRNSDLLHVPRVCNTVQHKQPLPRNIRHLLDKRSRAFARYKATGLSEDANSFISIRNLCKDKIRQLRRKQQEGILARARVNRSVLFSYMRRTRKNPPSALALTLPDGSPATSPSEVAEIFLSHFSETFNIPSPSDHPNLDPLPQVDQLEHFYISPLDVEHQLKRLNPYSSMGPDEIHPRILKESADVLSVPYASLFQMCLDEGVFPPQWKNATVIPVYKKGDRHLPVSYRPISLTSIPGKIFERILKRQILDHLLRNGLIDPSQHGFLPGRSCISNMLTVMDSLTHAYDEGQISHAVFIDFAKAFDRVPHVPLLHKLERYGVSGRLLSLLSSFLSDRSFSVRIGTYSSPQSPVSIGVPQGSVLGPILFLVYINDLPRSIPSSIAMYADDVTIWGTDPSQLQIAVDSTKRWSTDWSLPLNDAKCVSMSFNNSPGHSFSINGSIQLQRVDQHKVLGFLINSNLSFSSHQQQASKTAFRVLNMIRRNFPRITREDFHFLYGTYVRPLLEYGSQIAHSGLIRDRNSLEHVQRRATKMVHGLSGIPYPMRMEILNLYPLEVRRVRGDLFLMFNLFSSGLVDRFFTRSNLDHLRGHNRKIFKTRPRTFIRSNFFTVRVISLWNSLPLEIVECPSKQLFKSLLDKHLGLTLSSH